MEEDQPVLTQPVAWEQDGRGPDCGVACVYGPCPCLFGLCLSSSSSWEHLLHHFHDVSGQGMEDRAIITTNQTFIHFSVMAAVLLEQKSTWKFKQWDVWGTLQFILS